VKKCTFGLCAIVLITCMQVCTYAGRGCLCKATPCMYTRKCQILSRLIEVLHSKAISCTRQGVRFLGIYTLQCCCHNLICIVHNFACVIEKNKCLNFLKRSPKFDFMNLQVGLKLKKINFPPEILVRIRPKTTNTSLSVCNGH
jgi:hypothetical protein